LRRRRCGAHDDLLGLPAIRCDRYHWLSPELFTNAIAACNALPGPLATKMAFYIGNHQAGLLGGLVALVGVLLPSTVAIAVAAGALIQLQRSATGTRFLMGIRPAVIAIFLALAWDLAPSSVRGVRTALLGIAVFVAVVFFKVHPALALIASGVLGILLLR
jgi:chromate transporter